MKTVSYAEFKKVLNRKSPSMKIMNSKFKYAEVVGHILYSREDAYNNFTINDLMEMGSITISELRSSLNTSTPSMRVEYNGDLIFVIYKNKADF